MQILGLCGSLRNGSFNRQLLYVAEMCLPEGVMLKYFDCGNLPFYNEDLDMDEKPQSVMDLIESVGNCNALLFASPEYNHSIPGVLKNAIDWASRPAYQSILAHKPAGIISGSKSVVGGARMQVHLRQVLHSTLVQIYPAPDYLVPQIQNKMDHNGQFADTESLKLLKAYMNGFVIWAGRAAIIQ